MNSASIFRTLLAAGALAALSSADAAAALPALESQPLAARSVAAGTTLFTELKSAETGIVGENRYDDPRMWGERFRQFEVGAIGTGIAIGDYDGDGRPDVFVVSKTESCRLYRNLGGWKFEDVTVAAGVADQGAAAKEWKQGATFADVNNDGRLDLYVCRFAAPNLLYINQGDGTFKEEAAARGLALVSASSVAAFCDYDRDGWLDVYVQTNFLSTERPNGEPDVLYHNRGDGTFAEVTAAAGISGEGYGHAATWWDYDGDGWPDLYVGNDFSAPDHLYHNNRNGTFTDAIDRVIPHMPFSAMGSDFGDVDNDGNPDLLVAEMAATTHEKDVRAMAEVRSRLPDPPDGSTAAPQYYYNALYLNNGTGRCNEAAFLTGLARTNWTWSVRFEDLDNDGRVDLHVTTGMYREIHNTDLVQRMLAAANPAERVRISRGSPMLAERNLAFRNLGDLRFEEIGAKWGLDQEGVSFGAALGDLDGDGDLDLVVANYQGPATVLRNDAPDGHRLEVRLRGVRSNRFGVGARVTVETAAGRQVRDLVLARGYLSTSEPMLHFGLGDAAVIRRLTVSWPSGARQVFENVAADCRLTITETPDAAGPASEVRPAAQWAEIGATVGLQRVAREGADDELATQPLLPFRHNRLGPALAVGDLDGDGRDDVVLGGTTCDAPQVLRQTAPGRFEPRLEPAISASPAVNDGPLLLLDVNHDGRPDLLECRGGANLVADPAEYQPRLWLGGANEFQPAPADALPELGFSVGAACAADFNRDGEVDLFLGGRVTPGEYPLSPPSALLVNRGGRFVAVTDSLAPVLQQLGMVTAALWSDADGDGWPDLLVAIEWGGVRYFHNDAGAGFTERSAPAGFAAAGTGWWTSLATADFNGDGRPDFVAGNMGLNTPYQASPGQPAVMYYGQFSEGRPPEIIEGYSEDGRLLPRRVRRELGRRLPEVLKKFASNDRYARATLPEIVGTDRLESADKWTMTELRSGIFLSQPDGTWRFAPLPRAAQLAPLQGIVTGDFDGDGHVDLVAAQNSYAPAPALGRFDGGLGVHLRGNGRGDFAVVPPAGSGFVVPGDAKALAVLDVDGDGANELLVARNQDTSLVFRSAHPPAARGIRVVLRGHAGNPTAIGSRVTMEYADGSKQLAEVSAGSGFMSQSSPALVFTAASANPPRRLTVRWPTGTETRHEVTAGPQLTLSEP